MGKGKILIVDDDASLVKMLNVRLGVEGFETALAVDGGTAVQLADEFNPDVILLDIAMPSVTGVDVIEQLKMSDHNKDVPVIIMTAYPHMIKLVEGYSNVEACFKKPFDVPKLLAKIEATISENKN